MTLGIVFASWSSPLCPGTDACIQSRTVHIWNENDVIKHTFQIQNWFATIVTCITCIRRCRPSANPRGTRRIEHCDRRRPPRLSASRRGCRTPHSGASCPSWFPHKWSCRCLTRSLLTPADGKLSCYRCLGGKNKIFRRRSLAVGKLSCTTFGRLHKSQRKDRKYARSERSRPP